LQQLEAASFAILHHGIKRLGIVCHDIDRDRPRYFSTGDAIGVRLADVARASAAVPFVLPVKTIVIGTDTVRLTDGGISDSLPIEFVRSSPMGATHVIASDCRASVSAPPSGSDWLAYIRPDLDGIRPLHAPRAALMKAVCRGEAAVTDEVVDQIQSWMRVPATS
jgi:predicted acylesterase/phospholipase RssA